MAKDPITIEVIASAMRSLIAEMDAAIERTAMSCIIREQHDVAVGLLDADGRVLGGIAIGGQTLTKFAKSRTVRPGDAVLYNDPYLSEGEISHLGDLLVGVPIFFEEKLVAWAVAWGHQMDVGASAPSSMPSRADEVFVEGLQVPPVKLFRPGTAQR